MGWIELAAGAVIGWFGHVAQVVWADRRKEKQVRVNLGNRASGFLTDLGRVWKDIMDGKVIEDRRIGGLDAGIAGIEKILEEIMVLRDRGMRDRLTIWYLMARGIPDDVRLFNADKVPKSDPYTVAVGLASLVAARGRIERTLAQGQEFGNWFDIYDGGPGRGLEPRISPQGRP